MRPVVFGTAGHIDHGKTSLVLALTGVDCDRLPEEKRRGITLVLGFASLPDPRGELEVSFIDVPGHERLVHTMIAGAGGIDRAMLVIAADEGVMPQTREHLDILALLGVRGGVVALNKADLLDEDLLELRIQEVREALASGPLVGAPVIPCSAVRGDGLEALRVALLESARGVVRENEEDRPFRLSADRIFSLPGAGTVVTGTARWGVVRPGEELLALPSGRRPRVRGVQVHGTNRERGQAGERVALSLPGVAVEELPRGEQLLGEGPWRATSRLALRMRLLPDAEPVLEGTLVWLHLLAARVLARVVRLHPGVLAAGEEGWSIVRLSHPLFAAPGDRVIVRRVSPARTLGGGTVLDVEPPRLRRRDAPALADLPDPVRSPADAVAAWTRAAGEVGLALPDIAARLGRHPDGVQAVLGRLVEAKEALVVALRPPVLLDPAQVASAIERARATLDGSGAAGIPVAELLSRVVPAGAARLREFYLAQLRQSGIFGEVGGRAMAGGHAPVEDPLTAQIERLYREAGLEAPSPEETAARLGAKPKVVEGLVRSLLDRKRLARVGGKWVLHREVLDGIAASVRAWGVEAFDVGQFKDRFGLTRKLAIPILEWLDSERVTRREGEQRRVLPVRAGRRAAG